MTARVRATARWLTVIGLAVGMLVGTARIAAADVPVATGSTAPTTPSATAPAQGSEPDVDAGHDDSEISGARRPYPGDPEQESALVASEDARLSQVRTIASLSRWKSVSTTTPYRLTVGSSYTLILTQRRAAYTTADLLKLAPQTFVRQADGSYLLSEHLVIEAGATLQLSAPGKLAIKLASGPKGFVSIVNYGGRLNITGTTANPVTITAWDADAAGPDARTTDGRAYLRSIGGQVAFDNVKFSDLGFWSGRTGGLSLTGTDRPTPGELDTLGKQVTDQQQKQQGADSPPGQDPQQTSKDGTAAPAGPLPVPQVQSADPQYSYVAASIHNTSTSGDAFGLFVAGANGVDIRGGAFDDSLVDGIVLHRFVTNAVVQNVSTTGNAGDGIVLSRATTGVVLSEVTSSKNSRNGVSMSGLALASRPSATGTSVGDYGNNSVTNSTIDGNGRYGVEVIGGRHIGVQANNVADNGTGIVVRDGASDPSVVGNQVSNSATQGIAVRDGVSGAVVSGNIVDGGTVSIYLRDAVAQVEHNTLAGATSHGVSIVGTVTASSVDANTISGRGPSAIDSTRAIGADLRRSTNNTAGWTDTTPWWMTLKRLLQPMTMVWLALLSILMLTAFRGLRARRRKAHPYTDKRPISSAQDIVHASPPQAMLPVVPARPGGWHQHRPVATRVPVTAGGRS